MSVDEVAAYLGMSRQNVHRIEKIALRKMRAEFERLLAEEEADGPDASGAEAPNEDDDG
jgi:DNA-directed RNA polymerase sigma subunit (sigma70/sigma32)